MNPAFFRIRLLMNSLMSSDQKKRKKKRNASSLFRITKPINFYLFYPRDTFHNQIRNLIYNPYHFMHSHISATLHFYYILLHFFPSYRPLRYHRIAVLFNPFSRKDHCLRNKFTRINMYVSFDYIKKIERDFIKN